jgi:hypothetical protein
MSENLGCGELERVSFQLIVLYAGFLAMPRQVTAIEKVANRDIS